MSERRKVKQQAGAVDKSGAKVTKKVTYVLDSSTPPPGFDPSKFLKEVGYPGAQIIIGNSVPDAAKIKELSEKHGRPVVVMIYTEDVKRKVTKKKKKQGQGNKRVKKSKASAPNTDKDDEEEEESDRKLAKELPIASPNPASIVANPNSLSFGPTMPTLCDEGDYENLDALEDGAVIPEAVVTKGPAGQHILVPVDTRGALETTPIAIAPDKPQQGYLRRAPDALPAFIAETDTNKAKTIENAVKGRLLRGPHGESLFVPDGVQVDEKGRPIPVKVLDPHGREVKVDDIGGDAPVSGFVKLRKNGQPEFTSREIEANMSGEAVVAMNEPAPAFAVTGVLVKDQKDAITFLSTEPYGVGAAKKAMNGKLPGVAPMNSGPRVAPPVGTVISIVAPDKRGCPKEYNKEEAEKNKLTPIGYIVQGPNAPVYVPKEKWEANEKKATVDKAKADALKPPAPAQPLPGQPVSVTPAPQGISSARPLDRDSQEVRSVAFGGPYGGPGGGLREYDARAQPVGAMAVSMFLKDSSKKTQTVTLATQIDRAKSEGRTLKAVQLADFEQNCSQDKARKERMAELKRSQEVRSVAFGLTPGYSATAPRSEFYK